MATVADLERLQALLNRLAPLAGMRRGSVIRADDWNLLVDAVTDVARTVLAEAPAGTVEPHEHTDQVQLSWLDGRLRDLVTTGGLTDPVAAARVSQLEREVRTRRDDLDALDGRLTSLRGQLAELGTRDLVRQADVTKVRRTVEAVGDARRDVTAVRESLDSIRGDLDRVIEIGRRLESDGAPIDVRALVDRVTTLEGLRTRLTRPDGSELDASELERRLTELTTTLVTEDELDEALRTVRPTLPAAETDRIRADALAAVETRVATGLDGLRAEMAATFDDRLSDVDARAGRAVQAQLPVLRDELLATVGGSIDAAVTASAEELRAQVERRLDERDGELNRDLGARIDAATARIEPAAAAEVRRRLDERLPAITTALAGLTDTAAALRNRADGVDASLAAQAEALAAARTEADTVDSRIERATRDAREAGRREAREMVDAASGALRAELTALATRLVTEHVGTAVTSLRGEIREIARDELAQAMPEVDRLVTNRLDERFRTLPDTLAGILRADVSRTGPLHQIISGVRPR